MKQIVCAFSLLLILFLFVACQNTTPALQTNQTDQTEITVALDWVPNTNHTGLYVALEKGYYQETNLNVNIIQPAEDSAIPLVASGKADIGVSFQESLAFALEQNMPLTAIAAVSQHNDSGIISLKQSNINRPSDLANHRLATWNSDLFHAVIGQIVEDDGGNYDDIDLIYTDVSDIQSALETNIDAVWVYYGWDGIALENAGYQTNYFLLRDINPVFDFYTPILVANNDFLANQPEAAKAFLLATAKGYEYAEQHPDEAANILLQYAPELDPDMIHASQAYMSKQYIDDAPQWGIMDASRWNSFYQWMYDASLIQTNLVQQDQTGFTNEFLPKDKE